MTYKIVRFYQDDRPNEVMRTGLTLPEAQEHCSVSSTQGEGWFDGYEEEEPAVDPLFPDRPDHPDFWALSEAVKQTDGYASQGLSPAQIFEAADINGDSVFYMAKQRAMRMHAFAPAPTSPQEVEGMSAATWLDGFLAGLKLGDGRSTPEDGNRRQGGTK